MKVSMPEGATGVAFKTEDDVHGALIGPVWFVVDGELVPAIDSEDSTPEWPMAQWWYKRDALKMARHYGLELHEA